MAFRLRAAFKTLGWPLSSIILIALQNLIIHLAMVTTLSSASVVWPKPSPQSHWFTWSQSGFRKQKGFPTVCINNVYWLCVRVMIREWMVELWSLNMFSMFVSTVPVTIDTSLSCSLQNRRLSQIFSLSNGLYGTSWFLLFNERPTKEKLTKHKRDKLQSLPGSPALYEEIKAFVEDIH